ncbi:uncharacterized protein LOC105629135 [Jatropha curcas]|uniref:uncharacterized protein LOC105629135 n=1 Tax=Jatropha curcas TaxID=180498 RepID=UPI0005FBC065|nr:uncharacterized protein LOC105629135 [Jatropha curcas]XP_020533050.1 uncharacterized protein LOC105629135 [Jatropha curcas]XP_020533051.1 uncharacterized protein LOC105629135 [Jatropha curcas]XP_020533052.1 uncharacterized protein LOC105629135 [Jatropha curcas]XP_020533053.1 uncharacterized protein LOC105629135 [Jatropha curcas]XP_037493662.1 uncharacterized protein LOC105629135 [Jatropha curcas]
MLPFVQLRRSQRLKDIQPDKNSSNLEKNKPSRKPRGPRKLISKEQALPLHGPHQDNQPTEAICACSLLNQEKDMAFCTKCGRQRKFISSKNERNCKKMKHKHANFNNLVGGTGEPSNIINQDFNVIATPFKDPTSIGSICVNCKNIGTVNRLAAHISSKAGAKMFEVAQQLQQLLQLEMVSRLDVWPVSFDTFPPTDNVIDLYILPVDRRSDGVFDRLLNYMTGKDIVLKAVIGDVSVLVFTSLQLTYKYWRTTSGRYYLWAVFLGKNAFFHSFQINWMNINPSTTVVVPLP